MREGCEAFYVGWNEELENVLINRKTNTEVEDKLCYEISKACVGVDMSDAPTKPEEIWIDG